MTLGLLPLNKNADHSVNMVVGQENTVGDAYPNIKFNSVASASVITATGVQNVNLLYIKNSKYVTPGGNYAALYAYTLNSGLTYAYVYLAFKPSVNKLFMWKYAHATAGVGVPATRLGSACSFCEDEVLLGYYRLLKSLDTAAISATPSAPLSGELFEVDFKSLAITVTGALQSPPIKSSLNNVVCFAEGPAFIDSVKVSLVNGTTITPLIKDVDYYGAYQFVLATHHTRQRVFGALEFDSNLSGQVLINYSALGGNFGITQAHITAMNAVVTRAAEKNYEAAIRNALSTPLVINTWPSVPQTNYNVSMQAALLANSIVVNDYNPSLN